MKNKAKKLIAGFLTSSLVIAALLLFIQYRRQSTILHDTHIVPINLKNGWEFNSIHLNGSLERVSFLNVGKSDKKSDKKTGITPAIWGFWDDITPSEKEDFSQINTSIINMKIREMRIEGIWSIEKSGNFFIVVKSGFLAEATYIYSPDRNRFDPTISKSKRFNFSRLRKINDNWYIEE